MRSEIVMGGCYLGMAGHDVFNNKVREIVNTNEHRVGCSIGSGYK